LSYEATAYSDSGLKLNVIFLNEEY